MSNSNLCSLDYIIENDVNTYGKTYNKPPITHIKTIREVSKNDSNVTYSTGSKNQIQNPNFKIHPCKKKKKRKLDDEYFEFFIFRKLFVLGNITIL